MALRLEIDSDWSAADFAALFRTLDDLYANYLMVYYSDPFVRVLNRGRVFAYADSFGYMPRLPSLQVIRIKYSSPGFTDLAGIAAVVRELRELIQFIIKLWVERKDRELDRKQRDIEIASLKLEFLQKFKSFTEEDPTPSGQVLRSFQREEGQLPNIDALFEAVIDGRIVGASDPEEEEDYYGN
ncbi:hypothetical protein [Pseudoroseicyclus tamaricis]|uniref:Uncharacterized protein n=1 Tax=Pseudoroseicyclus tamaricis TaxID=2705421 RepID=A0A6B2JPD5_9RHOB|nr:hypothetical protein [Pseudoroseicyclus tamaricis]NDU99947.1 hypothetical protein [Pseudoroseicyclus tamaricis]